MKLLKTYPSSFYILFVIFLLFFSHTIFYVNNFTLSLFILFFLLIFLFFHFKVIPFPKFEIKLKLSDLKFQHIIILFIIIAPSVIFLTNISFGDFNWGGDHRDHVLSSLVNNEFWSTSINSQRGNYQNIKISNFFIFFIKSRIFLLIAIFSLTFFLYKKKYGNLANLILLITFYIWSSNEVISDEKDPRGLFFISFPFNSFFYFLDFNLMDAIRFTNFISIIIWLLLLRPVIIGEFPNLKILPFAAVIYWNPQMIYIINGGFTEPWSIIFLLLAIEIIIKKNMILLHRQ